MAQSRLQTVTTNFTVCRSEIIALASISSEKTYSTTQYSSRARATSASFADMVNPAVAVPTVFCQYTNEWSTVVRVSLLLTPGNRNASPKR